MPSLADQVAEYIRGQHLGISHQDIMLVEIGSNDVRPRPHDVAAFPNNAWETSQPSHGCLLWSAKPKAVPMTLQCSCEQAE